LNEIASLVQWLIEFVSQYLYAGIFIGGIICTSIPVLPSEVLFPLAGFTASQNHMGLPETILLGVIGGGGATVASIILYFASLKLGREAIVKHLRKTRISEKRIQSAENWFHKYGKKNGICMQNDSSTKRVDFNTCWSFRNETSQISYLHFWRFLYLECVPHISRVLFWKKHSLVMKSP